MRPLIFATCFSIALTGVGYAADWSQFRGPSGSGHIDGPEIANRWSSEQNMVWRTPLPGKGTSSPVVHNGRIYLTCYTGYGVDRNEPGKPEDLVRHLIALDRESGAELWRKSVASSCPEDPYQGFITQHGYASSTPVADGNRVYAFLGKSGLYAFDSDGNQIWHVDLGKDSDPAKWGDGSSPIVVGDQVIVDAGVTGRQLIAIDKQTGETVWKLQDDSFTNSWATPTPINVNGETQILFNVPKQVIAVDPATGKRLWTTESPLTDAACGSIVTSAGVAYLMGSRAGNGLAIDFVGSEGRSPGSVVWAKRIRSGICTPVILGNQMYWCTGGIFYAANLQTGEYVYKERLPRLGGPTGGFPNSDYASPIAVGDKIIQFTRNGESYVIRAGDQFDVIAHNPSFDGDDSAFSATPAVSDGDLFVRSEKFLYRISDQSTK